jgi:phosphatidylglycerol---prolipoprotein diacylglyceryl transferase
MYPNLYYFLKDVLGIEPWGFTQYINSFGFFVALSFLLAAYLLAKELKRKEGEGLLAGSADKTLVGAPASWGELAGNFLFGFIVGYKLLGVFLSNEDIHPQEYIFSSKGSLLGGVLLAVLFAGLKYREKKSQKLPKPELRSVLVMPHQRVSDITVIAAIAGFAGAKLFDNLENWDRFVQDPIGSFLSPSGLTFYGGLIFAAVAIIWFARKKKIAIFHLCDAVAPALMLSYASGRIGCHVSGDGDWGIINKAYTLDADGNIVKADPETFSRTIAAGGEYIDYLARESGSIDKIPAAFVEGPSFLPNWFMAYNYPHNVNEVGSLIPGCEGPYCMQLNPLVFPTPLYEIIACTLLFMLLWSVRKKLKVAGQLFGVYLILNGLERFMIEKIRVNSTYDIWGFHPTQAELISTMLMLSGMFMLFFLKKVTPAKN